MWTLLTVGMVVGGLLALPVSPWSGIALLAAAWASTKRAALDEEAFMGVLCMLAALGAGAMVAEGIWLEFIARP